MEKNSRNAPNVFRWATCTMKMHLMRQDKTQYLWEYRQVDENGLISH